MKYLRLYEAIEKRSIKDLDISKFLGNKETVLIIRREKLTSLEGIEKLINIEHLDCNNNYLTSLKGIEYLTNLKELRCYDNKLENLKGIENLTNLYRIDCEFNELTSIKEIKNLTNLERLYCNNNKITSLEGIENLTKIWDILCQQNKITNLDEIKNLKNLKRITVHENPLEYPGPYSIINLVIAANIVSTNDIYGNDKVVEFRSEEFQTKFLEEHPEKIRNLLPLGINENIKQEYEELLKFFNI